jgi:hypothetical protein
LDKNEYYLDIVEHKKNGDSMEIVDLITKIGDNGFYELCQNCIAAAKSQQPIRSEQGKLGCVLPFEEADKLVASIKTYVTENNIHDVKSLMHMLHNGYRDVYTQNPGESRTAFIPGKDYQTNRGMGHYGTLYDLLQIPAWDDIENQVLNMTE